MTSKPSVGTVGKIEFTALAEHAIDFADDQMPAVLCTPWLVWFLEHAAREAVLPYLETGESTVGTQVEIEHLAATPIGMGVTCIARVVHSEGSLFSFQLEARDSCELIARGFHKLRVIKKARFAERVKSKSR